MDSCIVHCMSQMSDSPRIEISPHGTCRRSPSWQGLVPSHLSPPLSPSFSLLSSLLPLKIQPLPPLPNFLFCPSLLEREREGGCQSTPPSLVFSSFSTFSTNSPSSSLTPWWGEGGETLLTPHPSQLCLRNSF